MKKTLITTSMMTSLCAQDVFNDVSIKASGESNPTVTGGSLAVGLSNTATFRGSAFGWANQSRNYSVAGGYKNEVGAVGAAFGYRNKVNEGFVLPVSPFDPRYSFATGQDNNIDGGRSLAMGFNNILIADDAVAIGYQLKNSENQSIVMGRWNTPKSDLLFSIGNGTIAALRSNALEIKFDGTTIIPGTLEVAGSPVLTTATAASILEGDFVRSDQINSFFRSSNASFGPIPQTTNLNSGINVRSWDYIGNQSSRDPLNSLLTLTNPGGNGARQLMFDPTRIYATRELNIEANARIDLIAPNVIVSNNMEIGGQLEVGGSPVVTVADLSTTLASQDYLQANEEDIVDFGGNFSINVPDIEPILANAFLPNPVNSNPITTASFSLGVGNVTTSSGSFSGGTFNKIHASGFVNFLFGQDNRIGEFDANGDVIETIDASNLFGVGVGNRFTGDSTESFVMGQDNHMSSKDSFAFGSNLEIDAAGLTVLGRYNVTKGSESNGFTDSEQPLFVIGNGTEDVPKDALIVKRNGDVIIPKPQGDISMGIYGN